MSRAKRATPKETTVPTFDLDAVKTRADDLGCVMQMFVAFNPKTEMFVFASNDPNGTNGKPPTEAAILCAIAAEHISERLQQAVGAKAKRPTKEDDPEDDEPPKLH